MKTPWGKLILFFALAFPLSWYPWIIALFKGTTTGPNPLGPFVAALIVLGITEGRTGIKQLLSRIVRWRVGIQWYAVIFLLPVVISGAALLINLAAGAQIKLENKNPFQLNEILSSFIFIFLFIGLGEEPGWRGFALEKLQQLYSPLRSTLILSAFWTLWHLPLMGTEFPLAVIPAFIISLTGGALVQTWVYNRTNGSVLLMMLFHSTVNTVASGIVFQLFQGDDFIRAWYLYAAAWLTVGLVVANFLRQKAITALDAA
jgi:membrane protease YdiL (CAAX protease family)